MSLAGEDLRLEPRAHREGKLVMADSFFAGSSRSRPGYGSGLLGWWWQRRFTEAEPLPLRPRPPIPPTLRRTIRQCVAEPAAPEAADDPAGRSVRPKPDAHYTSAMRFAADQPEAAISAYRTAIELCRPSRRDVQPADLLRGTQHAAAIEPEKFSSLHPRDGRPMAFATGCARRPDGRGRDPF
jgi:hypothetical protein